MNDQTAAPLHLPQPTRSRWQPLRLGLVELYFYEDEEFWFRDGHLLLRGNNGTGKSKVLSLTLPFLLDAQLSASRVEPDGDRGKRMDWNLLLGNRHERRTGYAWIEFGRLDEQGCTQTLTLGCGLYAVAGRSRVESWYFTTSLRTRRDFTLITPERSVPGRERLAETLGADGQIYTVARDYRRAVDERLFRLGEARYEALMDTLIQLRQPQLSKKPDETTLSAALSNSLPPLPLNLLEVVAQAMNHLDDYREELRALENLRGAVGQFGQRYRHYARIQSRRQAQGLRRAQTEFDKASQDLNQARAELEQAQTDETQHATRYTEFDTALIRDRAALDELRQDPVMRDARRLHDAEQMANLRTRSLGDAQGQRDEAQRRQQREQLENERRVEQAQSAQALLEQAALSTQARADAAGFGPAQATLTDVTDALIEMKRLAVRRREQLAQLRRRLAERDAAQQQRERQADHCEVHRGLFDSAQTEARSADDALRQCTADWLSAWRRCLARLQQLALAEPEALLAALAEWAENLDGEMPARAVLAATYAHVQQALAAQRAQHSAALADLADEDRALTTEAERLTAGEDRVPPPLPYRDTEARSQRPGAPLWQLVEFRDNTAEPLRAAVEAALEASGLLDAWVTPDGAALPAGASDAWLQPRPRRGASLLDVLTPSTSAAVGTEAIQALLAGIAYGDDDPTETEAWIAPDGRFRLAGLYGEWRKPQAEYLGYAARAAARARRLAQIEQRRAEVLRETEALQRLLGEVDDARQALDAELQSAPTDDALRAAQARYITAERARRDAQQRLADTEALLHQAEARLRQSQRELEADAADLMLPSTAEALAEVESAVAAYEMQAQALAHAIAAQRQAQQELEQQRARLQEAVTVLQVSAAALEAQQREEEDARARLETLRATVGIAVAELETRLRDKDEVVKRGEGLLDAERKALSRAEQNRARHEQKTLDAQDLLDERMRTRLQAVEQLQHFTATGLLAVACPELALPEHWTVDPALNLARRVEAALQDAPLADEEWNRVQTGISRDYTALTQSLSALGQQAVMESSDYGLVVQIVYQNRALRPDLLQREVDEELGQRRAILSAREREVLENHLQAEVAIDLQRLLREADQRVARINAEMGKRPTSTGVRFKLEWQPLPEGSEGAPVGLVEARSRLLNRVADAWSADDRERVGSFLQARIDAERAADNGGPLVEHLARALDYRRWHRFRVRRWQDGSWKPLSGPASSGERALGLTVPLFAAAASHYASTGFALAPRLVLLDEAFAGIDDEARAHCMGLIHEFDLDFVMTSEREWGCHASLPGVSICQIVRREGIDAVFVSRWSWDGRARRREPELSAIVA